MLIANTLEVLDKDGKLDSYYQDCDDSQQVFWSLMIRKLYSDVFQSIALTKSLIMQCLTYKDVYPSCLRGIIDKLIA